MYYVEGFTLPFEEDETHEFKGHRNIAVEELPMRRGGNIPGTDRRSRRAVSRYACMYRPFIAHYLDAH